MPGQQRKMVRLFRLAVTLREQLRHAGVLAAGKGEELLAEGFFMQKIDRPGVDLHQHVLGDQLIEIMAGGISLHRESLSQPAGGEHFAQVIRIEKIGLILQKSQQFRFTHYIPLVAITKRYDAAKERLIGAPCCFLRPSAHSRLSELRCGQLHRHFILLQR